MFSVTIQNLSKWFGSRKAFEGISLSHSEGVLGISGPNGSGKSTLLKCLSGLLRPSSGSIEWQNNGNGLDQKDLRTHLGYVAPYINLYHELSVRENVKLILQLRRHVSPEAEIDLQFSRFQLSGIEQQLFGELSTGQQQRARLACSLIYNPSVLFLDEPGANLDEEGRDTIRRLLDDFRNEKKTVFLASNNPAELDLADLVFPVG